MNTEQSEVERKSVLLKLYSNRKMKIVAFTQLAKDANTREHTMILF